MQRIENAKKNMVYSILGNVALMGARFLSRTVFIHYLGMYCLGIEGLFNNLIAILSLGEMGISSAITYSLYEPLAHGNHEKIRALMYFYQRAYRFIALLVSSLGLCLLLFLDVMVNDHIAGINFHVVFIIFVFNTSFSYLFSYKQTLLTADQKNYLLTKILLIFDLVTVFIQIFSMMMFESYYLYLVVWILLGIIKNLYINDYVNKKYPYISRGKCEAIAEGEKKEIIRNTKALLFHKIGSVCIYQTNNILISHFFHIFLVGVVSNYQMIINAATVFFNGVFNAASAGFGNLIVVGDKQKLKHVFDSYNFLAFWLFSVSSICLYESLNPFIGLWVGKDKLIDEWSLIFIVLNYFFAGIRTPLEIVKQAGGVYAQDKYAPIIQSVLNFFISYIALSFIGVCGIFLGNLVSGLMVPSWYRPYMVYQYILKAALVSYFKAIGKCLFVGWIGFLLVDRLNFLVFHYVYNLYSFFSMILMDFVVSNVVVILAFYKTPEFKYIYHILRKTLGRKKNEKSIG